MNVTQMPIDQIKQDPTQPRKVFDEEGLERLVRSLTIEGMIHPIEVDQNNVIIVGERRYRAALRAGWKTIPVIVNSSALTAYERLRRQLAENFQRSGGNKEHSGMNPIDTAKSLARLATLKLGKSPKGMAELSALSVPLGKELGIAETTIREYLHLLEEPDYVKQDILKGRGRTLYELVRGAPEEFKDQIKRQIAQGRFLGREEVKTVVQLSQRLPEIAERELERHPHEEAEQTNRILNGATRLALALEAVSLENVPLREQRIVRSQLEWIASKLSSYLTDV